MTEFMVRLTLFTLLPVLLGAAVLVLDRSATGPVRRAEAFLVPLFLVGVGGAGLTGFIADVFIAEAGSEFQREAGFASLAVGILGAVAAERRDGFREATVIAVAVFSLGSFFVAVSGGLAPDHMLRGLVGLAVPGLLIWFLLALRRAERDEQPTIVLKSWMIPLRRGSVVAVGIAATSYGIGNSTGQLVASSLAGIALATVAFWWIVSRAPSHRAGTTA